MPTCLTGILSRLRRALETLKDRAYKRQDPSIGYGLARWWARPAALVLSSLLARWGVHPNAVTAVALASGVAGAVSLSVPGTVPFVLGTLLLWFWYWLDHVDGQVARLQDRTSITGRYLDFFMHQVVHPALWGALAVALASSARPLLGPLSALMAWVLFIGGLMTEAHGAATAKTIVATRRSLTWSASAKSSQSVSTRSWQIARTLLRYTEVPNILLQLAVLSLVALAMPCVFPFVHVAWLATLATVVGLGRAARLVHWARGGPMEHELQATHSQHGSASELQP